MATIQENRLYRRLLQHHLVLAFVCAISFVLLYITRPDTQPPVFRTSFSSGYIALVLLAITLWMAPWNLLRGKRFPVSSDLRRDVGIWAAIMTLIHTGFGLNIHFGGYTWLYFFYPSGEGSHWIPLRHDLFGFSNQTGAIATFIVILLFATSNDFSLRKLRTPRWKKLQRWNYALFALTVVHTAGYQAIESQRPAFVATLVISVTITLVLQAVGFQIRRSHDRLKTGATPLSS